MVQTTEQLLKLKQRCTENETLVKIKWNPTKDFKGTFIDPKEAKKKGEGNRDRWDK